MNVNLVRRKNELIFSDLKMGDVFYPESDYCSWVDYGSMHEEYDTDLYMVIDPVEYDDYNNNHVELNAVKFNDGTLTYFSPSTVVRKCIATIGAEG